MDQPIAPSITFLAKRDLHSCPSRNGGGVVACIPPATCKRPTPFSISDILGGSGTSSVGAPDPKGTFSEEAARGRESRKSVSSEEARDSDSDTERAGRAGVLIKLDIKIGGSSARARR